jgi:hypothetical protein
MKSMPRPKSWREVAASKILRRFLKAKEAGVDAGDISTMEGYKCARSVLRSPWSRRARIALSNARPIQARGCAYFRAEAATQCLAITEACPGSDRFYFVGRLLEPGFSRLQP